MAMMSLLKIDPCDMTQSTSACRECKQTTSRGWKSTDRSCVVFVSE